MKEMSRWAAAILTIASTMLVAGSIRADEPIVLKENGSWCWFQSQRAVGADGKVFFTSVAGDNHGHWDGGDLVATVYDTKTGNVEHHRLHAKLNRDDHAVAGLSLLSDGRLLAVYGKHGGDRLQRWRITVRPGDITEWTDEQVLDVGARYTYSNVYQLAAEQGRIYNFHRGLGFNPNCSISDDGGTSWRYGWRLLERTGKDLEGDARYTGLDGRRPYVCYASNGHDAIHFVLTDDHPRAYDNSIYHGYYKDGKLHASDGSPLRSATSDHSSLKPLDFTEVFRGDADHVAWACDIQVDESGYPYIVFSVQVDGAQWRHQRAKGGLDHRYYYGRWDGDQWHVHPMAYAGTKLYAGEDDYTGLAALDPHDSNTVVISTNANPDTGEPLVSSADGARHWELFQGSTADGGASWRWSQLTSDSTEDQLRPVIPALPGGDRVVLWARGKLKSYRDYHLDIVALSQTRELK